MEIKENNTLIIDILQIKTYIIEVLSILTDNKLIIIGQRTSEKDHIKESKTLINMKIKENLNQNSIQKVILGTNLLITGMTSKMDSKHQSI